MGPIVFVGLTIYTIVMQPGPDGLANPADTMDMKTVQRAPLGSVPRAASGDLAGLDLAGLAGILPAPVAAGFAPRLSMIMGEDAPPDPVPRLPPVSAQSRAVLAPDLGAEAGAEPARAILWPMVEPQPLAMRLPDLPMSMAEGLPAQLPLPEAMRVTGDAVHLRGGPAVWHEVLAKLTRDAPVLRLGTRGNWSRISVGAGAETQSGWIYSRYLDTPAP
ncbi:MAG TPA: hypothetical protein DCS45_20780 [Roseovarius nubinhibens]|uniref:SH3b domain-containing protein n=2 Tax=Roseovarius nubinhibens TaxID=314263 RepID=A0A348WIC1_9RHOB|nr:hypothetical protein [Roseovarius nubinhibens]